MERAGIRTQAGFSMVELMVALVIGVILLGGVISVYISSKSSYNVSNGLGQVEQSGRSALNFIQPRAVMAGYVGCSRPGSEAAYSIINGVTSSISATPVYNFVNPVFGYEANGTGIGATIPSNGGQTVAAGPTPPQNASLWTPALTWNDTGNVLYSAIKSTLLQYNDVLMIHAAASNPAPLIAPYDDGTSLYILSNASATAPITAASFSAGEFAVVSTCDTLGASSFQISATSATAGTLSYGSGGTPGNNGSTVSPGGPFNATGSPTVQLAQTYVFYVGKGIDGWPALFQASFTSSGAFVAQEMVSGVENMQVLYGVDTDLPSPTTGATPDYIPNNFETADQVQNDDGNTGNSGGAWDTPLPTPNGFGQVVSVRIALVMQSDDNSIDKAPAAATTFHMLGISATDSVSLTPPIDRRVRRYFVQTFSLRNIMP